MRSRRRGQLNVFGNGVDFGHFTHEFSLLPVNILPMFPHVGRKTRAVVALCALPLLLASVQLNVSVEG